MLRSISCCVVLLCSAAMAQVAPPVERVKVSPQDACQFKLVDGKLAMTTKITAPEKSRYKIIELEGLPGSGSVYFTPPGSFRLSYSVRTAGGQSVYISVQQGSGYLTLSRRITVGGKMNYITLSQGNRAGAGGDSAVRLTVNEIDSRTGQSKMGLDVSASDILTLRRQHAKEIREHLSPLLHLFGSRTGLDVDPEMARQALVEPEPKAELEAKVNKLVKQLNADEFMDRETAAEALKKLGADGADALRAIDRATLSEQQKVAVAEVLVALKHLTTEDVNRLRKDRDFLLDCLYCDDLDLRAAALKRLGELTGEPIEFDLQADADKRAAAIEDLRAKTRPGKG